MSKVKTNLPSEVEKEMQIIQSPFMSIIADLAKNNKNLTPELQNVIARYLDCETTPKIIIKALKSKEG